MKFQSSLIGICLLALSFFPISLNATEEFKYVGTLSYLDGTPALMSNYDRDYFDIIHIKSNTGYTEVKKFENNNIYIDIFISGDYVIKFMGFEITRFSVTDVDGQLKSKISTTLSLPFNYIAITNPNQIVEIYDKNINLLEGLEANKSGNVALTGNENYFLNKFLVVGSEYGFPTIGFFKSKKQLIKGDTIHVN